MVDFSSPYYPYTKTLPGACTLRGSEQIPYQLLTYLLDLPDAAGYQPVDDNNRPRVRFIKYLYYDEARPLSKPLPTPAEKRSLLFDPEAPAGNTDEERQRHPKGYRLLWQRVRGQSVLTAGSMVKCYLSRIYESPKFITQIGVTFECWCNVNLETNTRTSAYQRAYDLEQCIREALNGVNINGIGTVSFSRYDHADNASISLYTEGTEVGRGVNCSIAWSEGGGDVIA